MNEEAQAPVANITDVQSTETETEQEKVAKTEDGGKSEQSQPTTTEDKPAVHTPVAPTDKTADTTPKDQAQTDTSKPATQDKPAETKPTDTQPTTPAETKTDPATPVKPDPTPTTPEQPKKLADFLPGEGTNLVRISGDIAGHHFDCSPVTEIPFKITKARWPFVPAFIEPNPNYEFQTFNYDVAGGGQWIPIDSKSQGQILTDLNDKVKKIDKVTEQQATQNQTLSAQQTKLFMNLTQTVNKLTDKVDQLVEKDGDK